MSIKAFIEEIKGGLRAPAYLLCSDEAFFLKEALFAVRETVPESDRDFLYHALDMDSSPVPAERVMDMLYTLPLLGGRKVVALEGCEKLPDGELEKLSGYVSAPSASSVLFFLVNDTLKKSRRELLPGAKFYYLSLKERDLPFWVGERAARKGLRLTPQAVNYLIGTVGPDAGLLSSELEKLALSGKSSLDAADISEYVRGTVGADVFELVDALRAKDAGRVFRIYKTLAGTVEPQNLLGVLNWHYGRASVHAKGRGRKSGVFALLNEADLAVKSSGGAYPLEFLLFRLLKGA